MRLPFIRLHSTPQHLVRLIRSPSMASPIAMPLPSELLSPSHLDPELAFIQRFPLRPFRHPAAMAIASSWCGLPRALPPTLPSHLLLCYLTLNWSNGAFFQLSRAPAPFLVCVLPNEPLSPQSCQTPFRLPLPTQIPGDWHARGLGYPAPTLEVQPNPAPF